MPGLADDWTIDDVEAVLARADPRELLYVPLIVSLNPPDCAWSEAVCVRLSANAGPGPRERGARLRPPRPHLRPSGRADSATDH